jgi:hypothetical protein
VAQALADRDDIDPAINQLTGMAMPQGMEGDIGHTELAATIPHSLDASLGVWGPSSRAGKTSASLGSLPDDPLSQRAPLHPKGSDLNSLSRQRERFHQGTLRFPDPSTATDT